MNMVEKAMAVARRYHQNQLYGDKPYFIAHIQKVARLAMLLTDCPYLISGCLLHDILEDTEADEEFLRNNFGDRVTDMVMAVTDGKGKNREQRKIESYSKLAKSSDGRFVKLCDRITNIRESIKSPKHAKMYLDESDEFKTKLFVKGEHPCLWRIYDQEIEKLRKSFTSLDLAI